MPRDYNTQAWEYLTEQIMENKHREYRLADVVGETILADEFVRIMKLPASRREEGIWEARKMAEAIVKDFVGSFLAAEISDLASELRADDIAEAQERKAAA